jgi:predicted nuclease of predicted toxin-antitoxin system
MPAASDEEVAAFAMTEDLILITEDRDFGRLVYVLNRGVRGVLYVRWPGAARSALGPAAVAVVERLGEALRDAFVVLTPGRARVRRVRPR